MSIKKAREKAGLTQAQVAKELNINQSAVALWENGDTQPRAERLLQLSKVLKCSVKTLLMKDDEEK